MRTFGHVPQIAITAAGVLLLSTFGLRADEQRKPLTWHDVYGRERVVIRDPAPRDFVWLDDRTLLQQRDGWEQIDAHTGQRRPFFDAKRLQESLEAADVSVSNAAEMADGQWTVHDAKHRLCVLHAEKSLIRAGLDGDRIAVVGGIPENAELLTLSPTGNACAFVSDDNLWCADFDLGIARPLTQESREHVRSGKADWVYYEEVLRRKWKAFKFSPDGQSLVFLQFDDSDVSEFTIINHAQPKQVTEVTRYPRAGEVNPSVRLGIVAVSGGEIAWVDSPHEDNTLLITGFGWYPDSQQVYWYLQNRSQTWLDFVQTQRATGQSSVLFREMTSAWVESPGEPKFLRDHSLLMLSERSGWKHVEHISSDGQTRRAVTSGEWDVTGIPAINEEAGWMLITATRDSKIADSVYRVALADGSIMRLCREDGHHQVRASPSGRLMVDTWSQLATRATVVIRESGGQVQRRVHAATPPEEWREFEPGRVEIRSVPLADEQTTNAVFVLPPDFDPSREHPVWLKVYGGPRYARVKNAWKSRLSDHLLATQGIVVIQFDPRSAGGFGAAGAWKAWQQLGVEETRDVVAVCEWLQEQMWADGNRIGMSGYSYGGYLTSYVMTHSKCLAAGIAGSPVTDWANYDTIYTERYMGTPQENSAGYRKSSVVAAAGNLHGHLLLVHGLRDDNVHPSNTFQLVHALQEAGKQFELMVYPQARHAVHSRHFSRRQYEFILTSLGIESATE